MNESISIALTPGKCLSTVQIKSTFTFIYFPSVPVTEISINYYENVWVRALAIEVHVYQEAEHRTAEPRLTDYRRPQVESGSLPLSLPRWYHCVSFLFPFAPLSPCSLVYILHRCKFAAR